MNQVTVTNNVWFYHLPYGKASLTVGMIGFTEVYYHSFLHVISLASNICTHRLPLHLTPLTPPSIMQGRVNDSDNSISPKCWASVADGDSASCQHWVNVSCVLGCCRMLELFSLKYICASPVFFQ